LIERFIDLGRIENFFEKKKKEEEKKGENHGEQQRDWCDIYLRPL
jgi:hypothetical protein